MNDIKEKAKLFAIKVHKGQVRKSEPDKPMIMHPIGVAMLLEEYGYDDNVVAAGYLHDVVEDTKVTIEEIQKKFGSDVADLVMGASEPDKSLSWEDRKKHTIEETKNLSLRNKVIICADKINNLEDLMLKFQKSGTRDFSAFKRGETDQKWYYTSIYHSLITKEDTELPIFKRLKDVLDTVFYEKEDTYIKDTIFHNNEYYQKLKILHAKKMELQKLKALCNLKKTFIIEFSGTPRTGKTTTIHNLYDFFKKGGFQIAIVEEFWTSKYCKESFKNKIDKMSKADGTIAIAEEVCNQLLNETKKDYEILLLDRSINDRQIWNYRRYAHHDMSEERYLEVRSKYSGISNEVIDFLVVTYTDTLTCLKRDYHCNLSLEKRSFLNSTNVDEYNECLKSVQGLFEESVENILMIDTTKITTNDIAIQVASEVMDVLRKKYIEAFQNKYHLK